MGSAETTRSPAPSGAGARARGCRSETCVRSRMPAIRVAEVAEEQGGPDGDVRDVGQRDEQGAARLQPAVDPGEQGLGLREVLEHVRADDDVERLPPVARLLRARMRATRRSPRVRTRASPDRARRRRGRNSGRAPRARGVRPPLRGRAGAAPAAWRGSSGAAGRATSRGSPSRDTFRRTRGRNYQVSVEC